MGLLTPNILEIPYQDPLAVFGKVSQLPWASFLDSAKPSEIFGQYSYIVIDPFLKIISKNGQVSVNGKQQDVTDPFVTLKKILTCYKMAKVSNLPPFQGGMLGFFSYDLCHHIEQLPYSEDDIEFPDMMIGVYDLVIAFDLDSKKSWLISNGFSEFDFQAKAKHAKERAEWLLNILDPENFLPTLKTPVIDSDKIFSNFEKLHYEQVIQKTIDYIYAGDIFQANISQRFSCNLPENMTSFQLYCRLRKINPAPFAAYLNYDDVAIVSASPERFLKLENEKVETRPIKGTRPRGKTLKDDQKLARELVNSKKDQAENTMIVDLLRNDLSKVCKDHTVNVTKLCGLETYASVHHLVSVVVGELNSDKNAVDLLKATFPGGSITGAPKVRAMEIIAEIEPNQRGPYCGSIGYIAFNGDMDTSIIIRTFAIKNNVVTFQAGGGIVADSIPQKEYDESLVKASSLIKALTSKEIE